MISWQILQAEECEELAQEDFLQNLENYTILTYHIIVLVMAFMGVQSTW